MEIVLPCAIEILDARTGETAAFFDQGSIWEEDGELNDYMWAEGNYSCDCNRALFWHRAQGIDISPDAVACSNDRYFAKATRLDTGEIVFDEIEP